MVTGMHAVIYSRNAEADRSFLRDVLGLPSVDAGGGWLMFAVPPSEVAIHPDDSSGKHEIYLTCDDVQAEVACLQNRGVECSPVSDEGWGLLTSVHLAGGATLGLYEPRHVLAHGAQN